MSNIEENSVKGRFWMSNIQGNSVKGRFWMSNIQENSVKVRFWVFKKTYFFKTSKSWNVHRNIFHASDLAIRPYIAKIEVLGNLGECCRIFIYFYRVGIARGPVIWVPHLLVRVVMHPINPSFGSAGTVLSVQMWQEMDWSCARWLPNVPAARTGIRWCTRSAVSGGCRQEVTESQVIPTKYYEKTALTMSNLSKVHFVIRSPVSINAQTHPGPWPKILQFGLSLQNVQCEPRHKKPLQETQTLDLHRQGTLS